jgi:hypothetical protein
MWVVGMEAVEKNLINPKDGWALGRREVGSLEP